MLRSDYARSQSSRMACMGASLEARRAGTYAAIAPTTSSTSGASANLAGSRLSTSLRGCYEPAGSRGVGSCRDS